jgi:hypothetical protein
MEKGFLYSMMERKAWDEMKRDVMEPGGRSE